MSAESVTTAIGNLVESVSSWTPERDDPDGVFTYIDLSAVDQDAKVITGARDLACAEAPSRARQLVRAGDVLVSTVRPNLNGVAQVPLEFDGATASTGFCVLRPRTSYLDGDYLFQWVKSPRFVSEMVRRATGASYPAVSDRIVHESKLPLPRLPEQRRIAAILDKADELRAKRRAALAKLDSLTQSIFLDMFGDPAMNSKGWSRLQLVDLCINSDDIKCGPFGTQLAQSEYTNEGVPLWGIRHVNAFFRLPTREFLEPRTAKRLNQYSIEAGDIVMTRKGTIGNCAVYPADLSPGIMHSDLLRLRVARAQCEPNFIAHQLHFSRDVERQLALISGGAIMPGINVTKLKMLEVVVPPSTLQRDFVSRTTAIERAKTRLESSGSTLAALFASLQHHAFRGEL